MALKRASAECCASLFFYETIISSSANNFSSKIKRFFIFECQCICKQSQKSTYIRSWIVSEILIENRRLHTITKRTVK